MESVLSPPAINLEYLGPFSFPHFDLSGWEPMEWVLRAKEIQNSLQKGGNTDLEDPPENFQGW